MKDFKILSYSACPLDVDKLPVLQKFGVNSSLTENTALENLLKPYFEEGYKIVHFSAASISNIVVYLEKE